MKSTGVGAEIFDLARLCDNGDTDAGLVLVRSRRYFIKDERVLVRYASKKFFPLDRLKVTDNKKYGIIKNIDKGVINNTCGVIVKVPTCLTINLCKIAGALCADGHIQEVKKGNKRSYIIELDDKDKIAVQKFSNWFFNEFGYRLKVKKKKDHEVYSIDVGNKIIGRFLHRILGLQTGEKSSRVNIPKVIRYADKKYLRAFWLGVLTFDGAVNLSGAIELLIRSKAMIKSFSQFAKSEGISITTHKLPDKNGFWRVHASKPAVNDIKKWLKLFEKDSKSWKKIYYMLNDFNIKTDSEKTAIRILYGLYPTQNISKTSIKDVFHKIKKLKKATNNELAFSLGIDPDTLRKYRNLLKKANIIKIVEVKKTGSDGHRMLIEYNRNVETWRMPGEGLYG